MIDPSAALSTPVRAGPNGVDRVLVDKDRRVMDIFQKNLDFPGHFSILLNKMSIFY